MCTAAAKNSVVQCDLLHLVQRGGSWRAGATPRILLAVPNVTVHPSAATVPTSYYLMWHYKHLHSPRIASAL